MQRTSLCLGTAQLGLDYGIARRGGAPDSALAHRLLEGAWELGIRALDTAPGYGEAEARIGSFLGERRLAGRMHVTTKLPALGPGRAPASLARAVSDAVDNSRRRLGIERIDAYLLHAAGDLALYGPALIEALEAQLARGAVARLGVSVYAPEEAEHVLEQPSLTWVQHPVSLLDQRLLAGGLLARLQRRSVAVQARSLMLQGLLALEPGALPPGLEHARATLERLREVLARHGLEPVEAALAFGLSLGFEQVILGVDDPEQLRRDIETAGRELPPELIDALRREFAQVPQAILDPRTWPARA